MKFNKLTTTALAMLAAAALAASAEAQTYTNYNSGDALIGFEQQGNASDYVVDLGPVSQFIGDSSPLTFQLSTTDLSTIFSSSWAGNSNGSTNVQWGVVANDQSESIPSNTDGNSIWYTKGESTVGTAATAPTRGSASALGAISNQIQNLDVLGYANQVATTSTATSSYLGTIQTATAADSWSSFKPGTYSGSTAFGIGSEIEQPGSGSASGPTNSALDLFQVNTKTASNQPANLLGTFTLSSGGLLTFTEASLATPEPSAFALGLTAVVLFAVLRRRKSIAHVA